MEFHCKVFSASFDRARRDIRTRRLHAILLGVFHKMTVGRADVEYLTDAPRLKELDYLREDVPAPLTPTFKIVVVKVVVREYVTHRSFGEPRRNEEEAAPVALPHSK